MRKKTVRGNDQKIYTLDEVKDKLIGKRGTTKRDEYERDLRVGIANIRSSSSNKNPLH